MKSLQDGIHHQAIALASVALAYQAHAFKSVDSVVSEYLSDLTRLFKRVWDDELLPSSASRSHKALLNEHAEPAFIEGLIEGGVDEPELSDEDDETIGEWIATQAKAVPGLWDDIERTLREFTNGVINSAQLATRKDGYLGRLDVWARALRDLAGRGKTSALKDVMVTWRLGRTEEHCRVCNRLNGTKRRLSWFIDKGYVPQEVASETLDCGGYHCLCTLRDSRGRVVLPA